MLSGTAWRHTWPFNGVGALTSIRIRNQSALLRSARFEQKTLQLTARQSRPAENAASATKMSAILTESGSRVAAHRPAGTTNWGRAPTPLGPCSEKVRLR